MISNVKWKPVNINDIFNISYGSKFDLMDMTYNNPTVNFVGRTAKNNGVVAYVDRVDKVPFKAGLITVALGGSIGSSFIQEKDFYTAQNVAVLEPKFDMNNLQKLFICEMIQFEVATKFRAFGRELNIHIKKDFSIGMPVKEDESIDWAYIYIYMQSLENGIKQQIYSNLEVIMNMISKLDTSNWKEFKLSNIFSLTNCKCSNASELEDGNDLYYVGAKKSDNGVIKKVKYDEELVTKGNCIIFICDGQGSIGFNNYMDQDFIGSTTLMVGYNNKLNKYNGLFIVAVLDLERPKFSFGRKRKKTLGETPIKLPVDCNGKPDLESNI